MSLNGLDEVAVIEAYQAALAEPGGWSVASYATGVTPSANRLSYPGSC
jgi:hypothetical protein